MSGREPPSSQLPVPSHGIDVWQLQFGEKRSLDRASLDQAWRRLDAAERRRASAYHFDRDRSRYALSRAFLREVLSTYCGVPPEALEFAAGPHGKPYLVPVENQLRFNLSHSETDCLLAVASGIEIGVDSEHRREVAGREVLARAVLAPDERELLDRIPPARRDAFILRCWTRKEAMMKALGLGLSRAPNLCSAHPEASEGATIHWPTRGQPTFLRVFDISDDAHVAALALQDAEGPVSIVHHRLAA